jgi:hypothetical protein
MAKLQCKTGLPVSIGLATSMNLQLLLALIVFTNSTSRIAIQGVKKRADLRPENRLTVLSPPGLRRAITLILQAVV